MNKVRDWQVRMMARKPRVHYEGAVYHVIARGNNRAGVFGTDEEKVKYLEILSGYKERYSFQYMLYTSESSTSKHTGGNRL